MLSLGSALLQRGDLAKPAQLKRYRDIARLVLKYGGGDAVRQAGLNRFSCTSSAIWGVQAAPQSAERTHVVVGAAPSRCLGPGNSARLFAHRRGSLPPRASSGSR